jgi:hypothetical protein
MDIAFLVAVLMMAAMVRGPPQRPFLNRQRPEQCHQKLNYPAGFV